MCAADFVIEDFESRHGVRIRVIAKDEVANFLIRISSLCAGLNFDESGKNRSRAVVEGVEIEEVARGIRRDVVL